MPASWKAYKPKMLKEGADMVMDTCRKQGYNGLLQTLEYIKS